MKDYPRRDEAQKEKVEKRRTTIPLPTASTHNKDIDSTVAGDRRPETVSRNCQETRFKNAPQFAVDYCPEGTMKKQGYIKSKSFLHSL